VAYKVKGRSYKLTHAVALVDQEDKDKPVILLLTDVELPATAWTSEFSRPWNGARTASCRRLP